MRKITRISGIVAVVGIMFAAGLAPASADTVNSTISGGTLTSTSAGATLSGVTLDGTNTQVATGSSTQWSITDARGTGANWSLSVNATVLTSAVGDTDLTERTIPVENLTISPGAITAGAGADAATGISAPDITMLATDQALVTATGPQMGTYTLTPSFSLAIPANAFRSNYAVGSTGALNPYTTTVTYTIA